MISVFTLLVSCDASMRNTRTIPPDLVRYRNNYHGNIPNDPTLTSNLRFHRSEIQSVPDGDYIDNIHRLWAGDYGRLEIHHGYIQWLFPIFEPGLNEEAQILQQHEADSMKESQEIVNKILISYKMFLGFLGAELENEKTGRLKRATNYKERYANLNSRSHNYLRITRLLKFLGGQPNTFFNSKRGNLTIVHKAEVGLEKYKLPFLSFFIREVFVQGHIPNCKNSLATFWIYTLRHDDDLNACLAYLDRPKGKAPNSVLLPPGDMEPEAPGGCCDIS